MLDDRLAESGALVGGVHGDVAHVRAVGALGQRAADGDEPRVLTGEACRMAPAGRRRSCCREGRTVQRRQFVPVDAVDRVGQVIAMASTSLVERTPADIGPVMNRFVVLPPRTSAHRASVPAASGEDPAASTGYRVFEHGPAHPRQAVFQARRPSHAAVGASVPRRRGGERSADLAPHTSGAQGHLVGPARGAAGCVRVGGSAPARVRTSGSARVANVRAWVCPLKLRKPFPDGIGH